MTTTTRETTSDACDVRDDDPPAQVTDQEIEDLRADVMREWAARGKKTAWPEGRELLAITLSALNPQCHAPRRAQARKHCEDAIRSRRSEILDPGECQTCLGGKRIRDGETNDLRKCLDCNGTGSR